MKIRRNYYITEAFDFNEVLDNANNNDIINNASATLMLDTIIVNIKNTFKSAQDYKYSNFTVSEDNRIIVVQTALVYSESNLLQTRFIINEDNTIYVDYINCGNIKNSIGITKVISYIIESIKDLLSTPINCKVRIIKPDHYKTEYSNISKFETLFINYTEACFITSMVEKGYTNVSICNSKLTELTTDLEKEDLQKYNFGNIAIRGIAKISIIDNNIIKDFVKYAQSYMLPKGGYVLFGTLPVYRDTASLTTYLNKVALCEFNDDETLSTMQQTKIKITNVEVKLMCMKVLYGNAGVLDELVAPLPSNKIDKVYTRAVLGSILSGDIQNILESNVYNSLFYGKYNSSMLKAYYNFVIDDLRNYGPIYKQILAYNV